MFALTEQGNADRFVARYSETIRFAPGMGWLVYDGGCFRRSEELAKEAASILMREMDQDVTPEWPPDRVDALMKWRTRCQTARSVSSTLELAATRPEILSEVESFDSYPWLLNCENGVLDLTTGQMLGHSSEYRFTQISKVKIDKEAECPTWDRFLREIALEDEDLVRTLQMAVGSSLVGLPNSRVVFFLYGSGANGKSVFIDTVASLLGDYAGHVMSDRLIESNGGNPPSDLAALRGRRLVTTSEIDPGMRLSTALIKSLTGDSRVTACFKFHEPFIYQPSFKFWIATNHMPNLRQVDRGILDRIVQIPFRLELTREQQDPDLFQKLQQEAPGILQWALKGCLFWRAREQKLALAECVRVATAEYFEEQDHIKRFLEECTAPENGGRVASAAIYKAYRAWSEAEGARPMRQIALSKNLHQHGLERQRWGNGTWWYGIRLVTELESIPEPEEGWFDK